MRPTALLVIRSGARFGVLVISHRIGKINLHMRLTAILVNGNERR